MRCEGLQALDPLCQAGQFIEGQASSAVDGAFSRVADSFSEVAMNATTWLWKQINDATTLDLQDPRLLREIGMTAAIAVVLCLGLFVIQVITSVMRREPGGLSRALSGLVISFVGSALAIAATRTLLGVVDALSAGYVQHALGTNVEGLGQKFAFAQLANVQAPAATLLLSLVILIAVVLVWAAMMVRKMVLIIAAVLAPLAFAGATADITRAWVRRWIEFVCAMVVSKLLLVIILSIGLAVFNGAGQDGTGGGQGTTQLAAGSLILMMGGFAPWMAMRMFSFAGDTIHAAHASVGQATAGGHAVIAAPQKVSSMAWTASSLGSIAGGRPGMVGPPPSSQGAGAQRGSSTVSASGAPKAPPKFDLSRAQVTQPAPAKAVNPPPVQPQTPKSPGATHD
jgi:type IV secretion system protein TrbL